MIPSLFRSARRVATGFGNNSTLTRSSIPSLCTRARYLCSQPHQAELETSNPSKFVTLNEEVIKKLTQGDEKLIKHLKIIEFEYEISKQEGARTPSQLTFDQWKDLFDLPSKHARSKYLDFLFKVEMQKLAKKQKKEQKKVERETRTQANEADPTNEHEIQYGLSKSTMFLRIYDTKIDHFHNSKVIMASRFENPIIFDLGFHDSMNLEEQKNTAKQLAITIGKNRVHDQPFPIQFCNVNYESRIIQQLEKLIPTLYETEFPVSLTPKSYLDLFPREKLVYLTPHCRQELQAFDPDSIYIIGGIVDKREQQPLSLAKAKRENIKMAKLPLDRYLTFGSGSGKCLTLNAVVSIMLELKTHGDWHLALRHVPQRKLQQNYTTDRPTQRFERRDYKGKQQMDHRQNDLLFGGAVSKSYAKPIVSKKTSMNED